MRVTRRKRNIGNRDDGETAWEDKVEEGGPLMEMNKKGEIKNREVDDKKHLK